MYSVLIGKLNLANLNGSYLAADLDGLSPGGDRNKIIGLLLGEQFELEFFYVEPTRKEFLLN